MINFNSYSVSGSRPACRRPFFLWKVASAAAALALLLPQAFAVEYWKSAAGFYEAGDYASAVAEVDKVLPEYPGDPFLLRIKGVALMDLQKTDLAVSVLRDAVAADSTSVACRYFLAQALVMRGDAAESAKLLNAIVSEAPESNYAARAKEVLPQIENLLLAQPQPQPRPNSQPSPQPQPHASPNPQPSPTPQPSPAEAPKRWRIALRTAVEYDSNVSNQPSDCGCDKESGRLLGSFYMEFRPLDQAIDSTPVTLGLGATAYQSLHENPKFTSYDLTSLSARGFLSHTHTLSGSQRVWRATVSGGYTHARLDYSDYNAGPEAEAIFEWQWSDWASTTATYSLVWRDFKDDTILPDYYSRDGLVQTPGIQQYFYLFDNSWILGLRYSYIHGDSEGRQFKTRAHAVGISSRFALPFKLSLGLDASYQTESYDEFTPDPRRLDDVWTLSATLSRELWIEGMNAELGFMQVFADSNYNYAEYRRSLVSLAINYQF